MVIGRTLEKLLDKYGIGLEEINCALVLSGEDLVLTDLRQKANEFRGLQYEVKNQGSVLGYVDNSVTFFFTQCFMAMGDCQDTDAMNILSSDLSSADKYVSLINKLSKERKANYRDVVLFGDNKTVLGEPVCDSEYVSHVSKFDDYFEVSAYARGSKIIAAIIYDETVLYQYLLNQQLNLLHV